MIQYLLQVSIFKTVYTNLKLFPFKVAIKLPIAIGRHTRLELPRGSIQIQGKITSGMITFGIGGSPDLYKFESKKNYFGIKKGGKVIFQGKAHFASHISCLSAGGTIEFGQGFSCNNGCKISSTQKIVFGNNVLLGGNVVVRDSDGHSIFDINEANEIIKCHPNTAEVKIGNHVWIANNCSVLKGVIIPDENVVAYGSLVTQLIEGKHQIIAGSPAKVIKSNILWKR